MKIKSVYLENFGKFKNTTYRFTDGMNIVFGQNEAGKTTLQMFMKGILYGLSDETPSSGLSEYKKYKPWDEGAFGGFMECELSNGKTYRITRDFAKQTLLVQDETGSDVTTQWLDQRSSGKDFSDDAIGEALLGIDKDFFERTTFIRQNETRLATSFTNDLESKLTNFMKTGNEDTDLDKAERILGDLANKWTGDGNASQGMLHDISTKIRELHQKRAELTENETAVSLAEQRLHETQKQKKILQNQKYILQEIKECAAINEEMVAKKSLYVQINSQREMFEAKNSLREEKARQKSELEKVIKTMRNEAPQDDSNRLLVQYRHYQDVEKRSAETFEQIAQNQYKVSGIMDMMQMQLQMQSSTVPQNSQEAEDPLLFSNTSLQEDGSNPAGFPSNEASGMGSGGNAPHFAANEASRMESGSNISGFPPNEASRMGSGSNIAGFPTNEASGMGSGSNIAGFPTNEASGMGSGSNIAGFPTNEASRMGSGNNVRHVATKEGKKVNLELLASKEMHDWLNQQYETLKEQKEVTDEQAEAAAKAKKDRQTSILWFSVGTGVFVLATFLFLELVVHLFGLPAFTPLRERIAQNELLPMQVDNQALLVVPYIWIVVGYLYVTWRFFKNKKQQIYSSHDLAEMERLLETHRTTMKNTLEQIGIPSVTAYNVLHEKCADLREKIDQCNEIIAKLRVSYEELKTEAANCKKEILTTLSIFQLASPQDETISEEAIYQCKALMDSSGDKVRDYNMLTQDVACLEMETEQQKADLRRLLQIPVCDQAHIDRGCAELHNDIEALEKTQKSIENKLKVVLRSYDGEEYHGLHMLAEDIFRGETVLAVQIAKEHSKLLEKEIDIMKQVKLEEQAVAALQKEEKSREIIEKQLSAYERKKGFLETSIKAIQIAKDRLQKASEEVSSSFTPYINEKIHQILGKITDGKHQNVMSDKAQIGAADQLGYLSYGTVDQLYIAMRIAVSDFLSAGAGKETLPFIIDEAFSQYDDDRFSNTLKYLREYGAKKQIVFFSCKEREADIAKEIYGGMAHLISLR